MDIAPLDADVFFAPQTGRSIRLCHCLKADFKNPEAAGSFAPTAAMRNWCEVVPPQPLLAALHTAEELARPYPSQVLKCLLNPRVGPFVAVNHESRRRLRCLVRVAGIEGRRWVVLDAELDCLRDLRPGKFGHDAECEVNSCRDAHPT